MFLKNGEPLLSCLTHEGFFYVADSVKPVFDGFETGIDKDTRRAVPELRRGRSFQTELPYAVQ